MEMKSFFSGYDCFVSANKTVTNILKKWLMDKERTI